MSGRKGRDPARVARDRLLRLERQAHARSEAQAVTEGVVETVALSRARGQAVTQPPSRKRLQPYRRQSGLEWLAAKGRIGAEAKAAGERYGWAYRRVKLEKAIPSTLSDRVRGAFVAPDLEEVLARGGRIELPTSALPNRTTCYAKLRKSTKNNDVILTDAAHGPCSRAVGSRYVAHYMLTNLDPENVPARASARRVKLTRRLVESLAPGGRDRFVWDAAVIGFGLKVSVAGRRTYVLRYRVGRRQRTFSIGVHGAPWTPEIAREEAKILLGRVAAKVDPQEDKIAQRAAWTVADLCEAYVAEGMASRKPASIATARVEIRNHIAPLLGSRPAASIECADIERLMVDVAAGVTARRRRTGKQGLSRVRGGRGAANSALGVLRAAFNFAIRRKLRFDNPTWGVRKYQERKLGRFLAPAELARLGEALSAAEALGVEPWQAIAAIRLLMLTGCRRSEILGLRRSYVDAHNSCLRLPDSKTGAKVVHVGEVVITLLAGLPQLEEAQDYVLPAVRGNGHFVNLQKPWSRIRAAAGLGDLRLHDLRHGFASLGASGGDSLLVIGALLGHRSAKTTERYAHLADHPLKAAAGRISGEAARLLGLAAPKAAQARRAELSPAPPGADGLLGAVVETRWVDTPAAAAVLGHTVGTLQTYRWMGTGPRFRRIGRRIVYALGDLEAWRAAHPPPPRAPSATPSGPNVILLSARRRAAP